jgi:hypothetical protein
VTSIIGKAFRGLQTGTCGGALVCAAAAGGSGARKNASVARSGRFSPVLHRIGRITPTILQLAREQLQLFSGRVLAGVKPEQTCNGAWRLFSDTVREAA